MKKNLKKVIAVCAACLCMSLFVMTGCGSEGNFADYMQGQPALRSQIDTDLAILSEDAKGSVQYTKDGAEITVTYYALTQEEIDEEETADCTERCETILQEAVDQYHKDTGKTAKTKVIIYGHDVEKK